jgi:hypothetical protein
MIYNEKTMRRFRLLLFPLLVHCSTSSAPSPQAIPVPSAKRMEPLSGARKDAAGVSADHNVIAFNGKALTPAFLAIDSFDVSLERREVVFSAKRENSFDIGLVSLDGSDVHWLPEETADEVGVQWAPRGHKVSYIIRGAGGDIVRTVHVPTAVQVAADFPYATVKSLAWDANAERYSVVVSSPDASERVESMKYDGGARRTDVAPEMKVDVSIEPQPGGFVMRPSLLRYNERLPLVVWVTAKPLEWSDARGALLRDYRVAIAVVRELPKELPKEAWIDDSRVFVVAPGASAAAAFPGATSVPHSDVESSASGWIAQHLKEANGRR